LTPVGIGVFQQESEQDQEWIFSIGTGFEGAGVIFNHSVYEIILSICTLLDLWQKLNRSRSQFLKHISRVEVEKIRLSTPLRVEPERIRSSATFFGTGFGSDF